MKILITGAKGQLGKEWMDIVAGMGHHEVIGVGSNELDISNRSHVTKTLNRIDPHLLINCAAYTDVDQAEDDVEQAFLVNEKGVENLAGWCSGHRRKMVHFSTDYVFPGRLGDRKRYPEGYPEEAPTDPVNTYGASKLAGEEKLRKLNTNHLLIRTSWLCGRYGNNFVSTMLRLGKEKDRLRVVNDQFGSPSFAKNVVYNTWNLIEKEQTGVFHVTSGGLITWHRFAEAVFELSGLDVQVDSISTEEYPTKARRPSFSKLNTKKLESIPGCRIIDWKEGLKEERIKG
ncbi:MAG: dTDP-4-dehydrorhamnose reductase [Balneolaceae bacterium]